MHRGARYRLCGFGSSAPIGSLRSRKEGLGPLAYRPPELVDAAALLPVEYVVDASHDLWAAGCVCGELLDGEQMLPARGVGHYALLHSTLASMPPKSTDTTVRKYRIPKGASRSYGEEGFLLTMLADQPKARPPDARSALSLQWPDPRVTFTPEALGPFAQNEAAAGTMSELRSSAGTSSAVRRSPRGLISDGSTIDNPGKLEAHTRAAKRAPINKAFHADLADIEAA